MAEEATRSRGHCETVAVVLHSTGESGGPMFEEIRISCPRCGEKNPKPMEWLNGNDQFDCIGCGELVRLVSKEPLADLDGGRSAAAALHDTLNVFGGRS